LTGEIASVMALPPRASCTRLSRLVARARLSEVGTGPQDSNLRYFIATSYH
jgi:hypothetical protein